MPNTSGSILTEQDSLIREPVFREDEQGVRKCGFVIAKRIGNEIYLGYAILNPKDKADDNIAEDVAWRRLLSGRYRIEVKPTASQIKNFMLGFGRLGREGKFHPIRDILVEPMTNAIHRASRGRSRKLPS